MNIRNERNCFTHNTTWISKSVDLNMRFHKQHRIYLSDHSFISQAQTIKAFDVCLSFLEVFSSGTMSARASFVSKWYFYHDRQIVRWIPLVQFKFIAIMHKYILNTNYRIEFPCCILRLQFSIQCNYGLNEILRVLNGKSLFRKNTLNFEYE